MDFNERHHAFISACFYRELKEKCPQNGEATFVLATQRYANKGQSHGTAGRHGRNWTLRLTSLRQWSYTEEYFTQGRHMEVVSKPRL